jgi:hypothetical protein
VNCGLKNQKKHLKLSLKQKMLFKMLKIEKIWQTSKVKVQIKILKDLETWEHFKNPLSYLKELELESLLLMSSMKKLLISKLKEKKLMRCKMSKTLDGLKSQYNL